MHEYSQKKKKSGRCWLFLEVAGGGGCAKQNMNRLQHMCVVGEVEGRGAEHLSQVGLQGTTLEVHLRRYFTHYSYCRI